jgi:N-acetylglucosaminyldiphosphoundecaprenol N-acetyl-beta-D-mannosaminyltransferase
VGPEMSTELTPRVDVLGVGVSAIDMAGAVDLVTRWVERRESHYVCVTGVHGVMESVRDPHLRQIHNSSGMTTPDGMPMVWSAKWAGADQVSRVSGPDLMFELAARASERGWTSYFYGGKAGVPELLAERLEDRYPGFLTVGTFSPPFGTISPAEDAQIVDAINEVRPNLVWVGLSTPKQERWMASHIERLNGSVLLGVGAAFDINAGLVRRAPQWMQRTGLEWLFRLGTEPRRLWRRYLRNNPAFATRVIFNPPKMRLADASVTDSH